MKAKAAVFMGPNVPFEVREFPVTTPPAGYGRCELIASGVCGTDVHFHRGKLSIKAPTVIGHEFVGRLVELDEAEGARYGLKKGDAVIADIAVPCGECLLCKSGDDANCVNMGVTNGGSIEEAPYLYGGYARVNYTPLTNLVKIPEQLDPTMTAVFACPGPTALHAIRLARQAGVEIEKCRCAVVQGLGPVGLFAVMALKALGAEKVYAVTDRASNSRRELALSLGADKVFAFTEGGEEAVLATLATENGGLGVDLCFEASGAPTAVPFGMQILRNRGVYLVPGQYSNSGGIEIQPQLITFKALHIIGSSQYSMLDVAGYLSFLEAHPELHASILDLATTYAIEDVNRAFEDACAGRNVKTVLI
ncbi:MAG: alcohol dehydrogenase catalytic domain-containing protein [Clostridia bacterium]|nr:alcohol dehydrogenase catalytic domain-containing protein [Clostridia bacterium]